MNAGRANRKMIRLLGFHDLGAAKIQTPIGEAFAGAMVSFQKHQEKEKP